MVRLLTERSNTKSNVKLGGFRSQLQASYVSSYTEELWYNETVSLWMTIYIYIYIYNTIQILKSSPAYLTTLVFTFTRFSDEKSKCIAQLQVE